MSAENTSRKVRHRLLAALRRELLGPHTPDEVLKESPISRYIVGRLAPFGQAENVPEDPSDDAYGVTPGEPSEEGDEETSPRIYSFAPSSIGLSFLFEPTEEPLRIRVTWGDYKQVKIEKEVTWQRYDHKVLIDGLRLSAAKRMEPVYLSPAALNPAGISIHGEGDSNLTIEGIVHPFEGYLAVSIFLVNRRSDKHNCPKGERWIFQPRLEIFSSVDRAVFIAKSFVNDRNNSNEDEVSHLLYRHVYEFATGHGVAAEWEPSPEDPRRASRIFSEFVPATEVPILDATPSEKANLDMKALAEVADAENLRDMLAPLLDDYDAWVGMREQAAAQDEIQKSASMRRAAAENLDGCRQCAVRMRSGLELLMRNPKAFKAFQFANWVMWDQRIHAKWAEGNRKAGKVEGTVVEYDLVENRTWRPFQMGFLLLTLKGVVDGSSADRKLVDLLFFPTGGGKTEAYLGVTAFTLAYRRLRGMKEEHGGAGVSILMRYTLRLLTVQQFQRATALICSCELKRQAEPQFWGQEPIRIGLWVGQASTPNNYKDAKKALKKLGANERPESGSPVQLLSCPRCGTHFVTRNGTPLPKTYRIEPISNRTLVTCPNQSCAFHRDPGLPVIVVDDEIYRTCPSLILATVDKFARLPFKGEAGAIFGKRNRYSPIYGHLNEGHGQEVGERKVRDAHPAVDFWPPELIIQDELHLISGPLGTMVGLYEAVVDMVAQRGDRAPYPAKIIASTATIRRAKQQVRQLYDRNLAVFPAPGLEAKDSYFASEKEIKDEDERTSGRLYVGINAAGAGIKTILVRVYSLLLVAAQAELDRDAKAADPYATLVGYFNSLRALGGAMRLVEDDVKQSRTNFLHNTEGYPWRSVDDPKEMTSRIQSWEIPEILKHLEYVFPKQNEQRPIDVLLATNMISVGVDIDRLGLMVVSGQPKASAEYIQATSRVGRKSPGLVVTMYNWMNGRDLSHYERFRGYHNALYRQVEAISVTPFSSRALDRGLYGVFAALHRLTTPGMSQNDGAVKFDPDSAQGERIAGFLSDRAKALVGEDDAVLLRQRLGKLKEEWHGHTREPLCYAALSGRPPDNSWVLLQTMGTEGDGKWPTPGSLREVEATAAFFLMNQEES